jgi:hypothetical protein
MKKPPQPREFFIRMKAFIPQRDGFPLDSMKPGNLFRHADEGRVARSVEG